MAAGVLACWHAGLLACWLAGWLLLAGWLAWLPGYLAAWLPGCLATAACHTMLVNSSIVAGSGANTSYVMHYLHRGC